MTALLRHGAKRIGGSVLQRTKAAATSPAVAEERRQLVTRRLYSTEEGAQEELVRKIQQRKEELYDVICKAEQSIWTCSLSNRRLLMDLSVRVKPRPGYKWHFLRVTKWAVNVVEAAGLVAYAYVAGSTLLGVTRIAQGIGREAEAATPGLMELHKERQDPV